MMTLAAGCFRNIIGKVLVDIHLSFELIKNKLILCDDKNQRKISRISMNESRK